MSNPRNANSDYSSFGTISDPGVVSGSTPMHESTAGAVGGALGGLAKILEVGIKYRDQNRESAIGSAVEDQLAAGVKEATGPTLLGESQSEGDPSVAAGFSQSQSADIDKLRQANAQQRPNFNSATFYSKMSTIVQDAIHNNPRYEESIRKRAQEVLGVNPTAAAVSLQVSEQKAAEEMQRTAQAHAIQTAQDAGEVVTLPNGEINIPETVKHANVIQKRKTYMDNYSKDLEDQIRERTLAKGEPVSIAESDRMGERLMMRGDGPDRPGTDAMFLQKMQAKLSTLPAYMAQYENEDDQAKINHLKDGIVAMQREWNAQLDTDLRATDLSTESRKRIREEYDVTFTGMLKEADGGYEHWRANHQLVQGLADQANIHFWQMNPGWMTAKTVFGPALDQFAGTRMLQEEGTPSRIFLDNQLQSVWNGIQRVQSVAQGKGSVSDYRDPAVKGQVVQDTQLAISTMIDNAETTDDPQRDATSIGNMMADSTELSSKSGTVENLHGFLDTTTSPKNIKYVDTIAKYNPQQAAAIGRNMIATNGTAIQKMGGIVAQSLAELNAKQPKGSPDQFSAYYNVDTGRVEVQLPPINPSSRMTNIPRIPENVSERIADINRALTAQVSLQKYGPDNAQSYNAQQLKQGFMQYTGLPLKPGQSWVPMPGEKAASSDTPQVGAGTGNLDRTTAGDNWATVEVGENGYHPTYVLPTQPGDRPANDETGFLGDAWERYKKTGKMYGRFLDENSANTYMKGPSSDNRVPGKLGDMIDQVASDEQVAPEIAHAFAMEESSGGRDKNDAGVVGKGTDNPMQLHPDTAAALGIKKITKSSSITGGIRYIRQLMDKYDGQPDMMEKVAAGYIAGPGKVEEYLKNPDKFPNTQKGVKRILKMLGIEKQSVNIQVSD